MKRARLWVLLAAATLLVSACLPAAQLPPRLPTVLPTEAGPALTALSPVVSAGTPLSRNTDRASVAVVPQKQVARNTNQRPTTRCRASSSWTW